MKGATTAVGSPCCRTGRFNPRARKGRDSLHRQIVPSLHVSIHAPARGATGQIITNYQPYMFQSTRPQGARLSKTRTTPSFTCFNPRARKGRDLLAQHLRGDVLGVSIHAPAKGATWHIYSPNAKWGFNPRARKGRDFAFVPEGRIPEKFQSTHPQRARQMPRTTSEPMLSFNPRAREGRDRLALGRRRPQRVSIHAPVKGATMTYYESIVPITSSDELDVPS